MYSSKILTLCYIFMKSAMFSLRLSWLTFFLDHKSSDTSIYRLHNSSRESYKISVANYIWLTEAVCTIVGWFEMITQCLHVVKTQSEYAKKKKTQNRYTWFFSNPIKLFVWEVCTRCEFLLNVTVLFLFRLPYFLTHQNLEWTMSLSREVSYFHTA